MNEYDYLCHIEARCDGYDIGIKYLLRIYYYEYFIIMDIYLSYVYCLVEVSVFY